MIEACAQAPRDGAAGTWIVAEMIDAYRAWHALGRVHSFETWIDGELVGGLYGVSLGRMFFGESMFARRSDASKIALAALVAFCRGHAHRDDRLPAAHRPPRVVRRPRDRARRSSRAVSAWLLQRNDVADWSYDLRLWEQIGVMPISDQSAP